MVRSFNGMLRSVRGSSGRPRTRSPTMPRWISSVPPAIDRLGLDRARNWISPPARRVRGVDRALSAQGRQAGLRAGLGQPGAGELGQRALAARPAGGIAASRRRARPHGRRYSDWNAHGQAKHPSTPRRTSIRPTSLPGSLPAERGRQQATAPANPVRHRPPCSRAAHTRLTDAGRSFSGPLSRLQAGLNRPRLGPGRRVRVRARRPRPGPGGTAGRRRSSGPRTR